MSPNTFWGQHPENDEEYATVTARETFIAVAQAGRIWLSSTGELSSSPEGRASEIAPTRALLLGNENLDEFLRVAIAMCRTVDVR